MCFQQHLKIDEKCYKLSWLPKNLSIPLINVCRRYKNQVNVNERPVLEKAFRLLSQKGQFPPILTLHFVESKILISKLTYKKLMGQMHFQSKYVSKVEAEGFLPCNVQAYTAIIGDNLFPCSEGGYVSYEYVCDGSVDCPNDKSDESNIDYGIYDKSLNLKGSLTNPKCSNLYFLTINGMCKKYSSTDDDWKQGFIAKYSRQTNRNITFFKCQNGILIDIKMVNDTFADCGMNAEDELPFSSQHFHQYQTIIKCNKPHEIQCQDGHSRCYHLKDTCIYQVSTYGRLSACRNGGHLENCKHYQCDTMFKCYNSYCIPWSYVCDGKWDCPHGTDENFAYVCASNKSCLGMYKCFKSARKCLHILNVCNKYVDCPYGDDEWMCELAQITCPIQCTCLLLAMECINIIPNLQHYNFPHIFVYISKSTIFSLQSFIYCFDTCLLLKLPRNNLKISVVFLQIIGYFI